MRWRRRGCKDRITDLEPRSIRHGVRTKTPISVRCGVETSASGARQTLNRRDEVADLLRYGGEGGAVETRRWRLAREVPQAARRHKSGAEDTWIDGVGSAETSITKTRMIEAGRRGKTTDGHTFRGMITLFNGSVASI